MNVAIGNWYIQSGKSGPPSISLLYDNTRHDAPLASTLAGNANRAEPFLSTAFARGFTIIWFFDSSTTPLMHG